MNHHSISVMSGVMLFAVLAAAQQPPATPLKGSSPQNGRVLLRVGRLSSEGVHEIRNCILLLPDGRYHREHSEELVDSFSRTPPLKSQMYKTYVFEGQLSPEEVKAVADIVNGRDFRRVRSPGQLHQSTEFFEALILREGEQPQSFILSEAADYKPNERALKPLFAWMNAMGKRKHDVSKNEDNLCRIPAEWKSRIQLRDPVSHEH